MSYEMYPAASHYITADDNTQNMSLSWPCGGEYADVDERLEYLVPLYGTEDFTWSVVEI